MLPDSIPVWPFIESGGVPGIGFAIVLGKLYGMTIYGGGPGGFGDGLFRDPC